MSIALRSASRDDPTSPLLSSRSKGKSNMVSVARHALSCGAAGSGMDLAKRTRFLRIGIIVALGVGFVCDLAMLLGPIRDPIGDTSFEDLEDHSVLSLQLAASVIELVMTIVMLILVICARDAHFVACFQAVVVLNAICFFAYVVNLANPEPYSLGIGAVALGFSFIQWVLVCVVLYMALRFRVLTAGGSAKKRMDGAVTSRLTSAESALAYIELLDHWQLLKASRRQLARKLNHGRLWFSVVCLILLALSMGNWLFEFLKLGSTETVFFNARRSTALNDPAFVHSYFGANRTAPPQRKVVLLVFDGLRYDYFSELNADFKALLRDPSLIDDAQVLEMQAQLPSMSVPNWVSICTGSPPEMTGVLGNLLVPETNYDSVFRQAQTFGLNRGLTGSPWFAQIVQSTLPHLAGDGTIATTVGADPNGAPTSDPADWLRRDVLMSALSLQKNPELAYQLFLAHFSDVDMQGHCCGVSKVWNREDTYNGACTNKSSILRQTLNAVDDDTVVVLVSDHGHVLRGGHGGLDPDLLRVPLMLYQRGSGLGTRSYNGTRFGSRPISNLDVAPTVAALLGVAVPRMAQGRFIEAALPLVNSTVLPHHFRDLFIQRQRLAAAYLNTPDVYAPTLTAESEAWLEYSPAQVANFTVDRCVAGVDALDGMMADARQRTITICVARNTVLTVAIAIFSVVLLFIVVQKTTFANIISLMSLGPRHADSRAENWRALLLACLVTLIYLGTSICLYLLCYLIYGYDRWDSTVIHTPQVIPLYVAFTQLPAWLLTAIITLVYHFCLMPSHPNGERAPTCLSGIHGRFRLLVHAARKHQTKPRASPRVHLAELYVALLSCIAILVLFIVQAQYTLILPGIFRIHFITAFNWQLRFRLTTMQLLLFPWVAVSLIVWLAFRIPPSSSSAYDAVYLLKVAKDHWKIVAAKENSDASGNVPGAAADDAGFSAGEDADGALPVELEKQLDHAARDAANWRDTLYSALCAEHQTNRFAAVTCPHDLAALLPSSPPTVLRNN